jgi:histidyl-tRNA synthetase
VLRAIDKLDKLGHEVVRAELEREARLNPGQIDTIFKFMDCTGSSDSAARDSLNSLKELLSDNPLAAEGLDELEQVFSLLPGADQFCELNVAIARGLDYYTGLVFETNLSDLPAIGSICSGGRYNNLASVYTRQELPGVGASIGLDRLLAGLEELGTLRKELSSSKAVILFADKEPESFRYGFQIASELRNAGIPTEVYAQTAKLGAQFKYADRKNIPFALIIGGNEAQTKTISIKDMKTGAQENALPATSLVDYLSKGLAKLNV